MSVVPSSSYYLAQTQLGWISSTTSSGPWEERLSLKIESRINERLSVSYDIEQEPETPQKSNVKVKYDNFELNFGEFSANFAENEFISANKYLDGVMLDYKDDSTTVKIVPSTKSKSYNQTLTSGVGNNTRGPYSLGRGSILEGSEKIWINEVPKIRGVDYTIDYFEGKITFTNILLPTDNYTYTYEYTNIIDLFFPTVSKREFFGISGSTSMNRFLFDSVPTPIITVPSNEATEVFPDVSITVEAELQGASSGVFRLKNKPLVDFSETVTLNGVQLKKLEEYSLNYNDGTLVLFTDTEPSESNPLKVSYSYYDTVSLSEEVAGIDSRGPYTLKRDRVVPGSEKVFVNGKEHFADLDYTMDYTAGKITFNTKIAPSSSISIKYNAIKTVTNMPASSGNSFKIGSTYLKETAKKGAGSATATIIENRKGSEITGDLLNLKHFPLDSTQTITVRVNGVDYTDFYVPTSDAQTLTLPYITDVADPTDGFATGTLKFNTSIEATADIAVVYTYKKSIYNKYTGSGNGSQGPYYITNMAQVVPGSDTAILVRAEGSSVVETYPKNSRKDTLDGKYKLNYNYPYIPYITFNEPFPIEKKFEIIFYSVPSSGSFQDSDLNHDAFGVTTAVKFADKASLDAAFGMSRTDQPNITESTQDTFVGNNTRGPYQLTKTSILEGTEKVYVNGFQQNKDIDYFMNYSTGQITFYYLTLTPSDSVSIQYSYQSTSGIATSTDVRSGKAFRMGGSVKPTDALLVSGVFKEIEPEFSPFESTNIGSGSQQKGLNLAYSPQGFFGATGSLLETKNQIGSSKGFYTWSTDRNAALNFNTFGLADASLAYRNYKSIDDIVPGASAHSVNTISNVLSGSLNPKQMNIFGSKLTNRNNFSKNETKNYLNDTATQINYFSTGNTLNLTDRITLGLDYQVSEPLSSSPEGISAHSISRDYTYDAFWDLKFWSLRNFSARGKIITHEQKDIVNSTSNSTRNQSINVVLDPTANISTSLDKSRNETLTVQEGKQNPVTERNQYSIRYAPFSNLSLNYSNSDDRSLQESGARNNGVNSTVSVNFAPFSFLRLGTTLNNQNRDTTAVAGTVETTTNQLSQSQSYTAGITLRPLNLMTLNSDFILENYKNNNEMGNIHTETQNITTKTGVSFSPLPIMNVSGNFTKKITKDILKQSETPKENWDAAASLQVFNWGTLMYTWAQERNLGEVQAGAVTQFDILRITNELSFSSTIPQSSPVLSSVVLSANYKSMVYGDNFNGANSFKANAMTFEGTLNF
ncbi:MAG: hypothetical protein WC527_01340 [Candidatus Margulisiibacteriota bacterium]